MKKLKIWLLKDGEFLPVSNNQKKMRTWRLGESLTKRGHEVLWFASNFSHLEKHKVCEGDLTVQVSVNFTAKLLECGEYQKNISFQRMRHHHVLGKRFRHFAEVEEKPDIIIASFPIFEFPQEAIAYGKQNDVPVIIDVRDMWPDVFTLYFPVFLRPIIKLAFHKSDLKIRWALRQAQGISSMSQDLLRWALEKAKLSKDKKKHKVFYLGFDESSAQEIQEFDELRNIRKANQNKIIYSFIGSFIHHYELDLIIEAAKTLEKDPSFNGLFIFAGKGKTWDSIQQKAKALKSVIVLGYLSKSQSAYLNEISDVSLIPLTRLAFPNKLFEYLYFSNPLVFSMQGEAKEILESHNAAVYYEKSNLTSLIKALKVFQDKKTLEKMRKNAGSLYESQFSDTKIYTEYCDYIEEMAASYKVSAS